VDCKFSISARFNEYHNILNAIQYLIEHEDEANNDRPIRKRVDLELLQRELIENGGDNITQAQLDCIIMVLLHFVPDSIKV